jgi:hypothetical protein
MLKGVDVLALFGSELHHFKSKHVWLNTSNGSSITRLRDWVLNDELFDYQWMNKFWYYPLHDTGHTLFLQISRNGIQGFRDK